MSGHLVLETIGWLGSGLIVVSLAQRRVLRFRVLNLAGAVLAVGYNSVIGIWPFAAMNLVITVLDVYWLRRLLRERHDANVYVAIEVNPDDRYLGHLMGVHREDIRRFYTGYEWRPEPGVQDVYLVERGDETVGVVVVRDLGDGVGEVELDYVTARFRDLTPGEFVYGTSGVFTGRGYRTLVASAKAVRPEAYFPHVGFALADGRWVRQLAA